MSIASIRDAIIERSVGLRGVNSPGRSAVSQSMLKLPTCRKSGSRGSTGGSDGPGATAGPGAKRQPATTNRLSNSARDPTAATLAPRRMQASGS